MTPVPDPETRAFGTLRRRLLRRRLAQIDGRLRVEILLLGGLLGAFLFWQVRIPLAGIRMNQGEGATLTALAAAWLVLALGSVLSVAAHHFHCLRQGMAGPAWLALPVSTSALDHHRRWESSGIAAWTLVPALGLSFAGIGLLPFPALAALYVSGAGLLVLAPRLGAALGARLTPTAGPQATMVPLGSDAGGLSARRPPRVWRSSTPWRTLCAKDVRLTLRRRAVGRPLWTALGLWALSLAMWRLPSRPGWEGLDYFGAFVLFLGGAAALGEWLIALSGTDPFGVLRTLPLRLRDLWWARLSWILPALVVLGLGHALFSRDLSPMALRTFLVWTGGALIAIAVLAVNYSVTLFPRADVARRIFGLTLGLAIVGSLLIPLLGWILLATAVVHSARRLPGWDRQELS